MTRKGAVPSTSTGGLPHLSSGGLNRRELLRAGAAMGLASPMVQAKWDSAPIRAASAQEPPTTLTIGQVTAPYDLDPHSQFDYVSTLVVRGAYEGLIGLKDGTTDQYEGLIAERWESDAEQRVWTFHLRDGVTFQDGAPCDAEAVRRSYERLLLLGQAPGQVFARFVPDPGQITAPDPRTVVFDLGRPLPLFEAAMASLYGPQVVNVAVALAHEEDGDRGHAWLQTNAEGTGTGPYRIVEFEPFQQTVLEAYDGYWGGWNGSHFERVVVRTVPEVDTLRQLVERGEVDLLDRWGIRHESLPAFEHHPDLRVHGEVGVEVEYFALTEAGPLASAEARQAVCYAFPYREVIEGVFRGYAKPAIGPVPETVRGFAPETFTYATDLARAKALFRQAGVAEGTELTLMQPVEGDQSVALLLQANLAEIGIGLSIDAVDYGTYAAIFYGDAPAEERPHLMRWTWSPAYNDAWAHLYPIVSCEAWGPKGGNAGFYCNERVDDLLAEAEAAAAPGAYEAALAEAQQILSRDDPPAVYYAQPEWTTVLRREIEGFVFNPLYIGTYDLHKLRRAS